MKIAVLGGSFNPVHLEHVNMVCEAIKHFNLDKVFVVPAFIPPHKIGVPLLDFEHRFNMLSLAFKDNEKVEVSNFEKLEGGVSYTYLTLEHFKALYPDSELYFMVGTDMLLDFPTWRNTQRILQLSTLIVTAREGGSFDYALDFYKKHFEKMPLISSYQGKNLSATKVKTYCRLGLDILDFVPKKVCEYITQNGLYAADEFYEYVQKSLPEKRRRHTANVITKALSLAKKLKENLADAELAALLHDVAKYKRAEDFKDFKLPESVPSPVVHQFLGAYVAENELGIKNGNVLNAIRFHTTGRENMSTLEKIVFIADLIEEDRNFEGVEEIRKAIDSDFESGFAFALRELKRFLSISGDPIYHLTLECEKFYNN